MQLSIPFSIPPAILMRANQALDDLRLVSGKNILANKDGSSLLFERAARMLLKPQGQISANGSCYLLHTADNWVAINLSRDSDWHLLPALFESDQSFTVIDQVQVQVSKMSTATLIKRASLLSLPIAEAIRFRRDNKIAWFEIISTGKTKESKKENPLVLDLSSLWAGPLCSRLLQLTGARVLKVESTQRPDGARLNKEPGAAEFYEELNKNKELVQLDFKNADDIEKLKKLIAQADFVIEGSRPRALQQLGIDAEAMVQQQAGLIWISITGYGRREEEANRVAFGDDAAISGGLFDEINNKPIFIGDAIADPLTGLQAALAAFTFWQKGQSVLLDINLHTIAKYYSQFHVTKNIL